eukprot:9430_1
MDPLCSLINIVRKLQNCKLKESVHSIAHVFVHNKEYDLLQSIIMTGICHHYADITPTLFAEIASILPITKDITINDSITQSIFFDEERHSQDKNDAKSDGYSKSITFLQIPSDLKSHLFQYLPERDLYSLEKTCRSVCIDARKPSSLYHMDMNKVSNINNYIQKRRYAGIRSLNLDFGHRNNYMRTESYTFTLTNSFYALQCIKLDILAFYYTYQNFQSFLKLFYNLLLTGPSDKALIIRCPGWNVGDEKIFRVFDAKYDDLAIQSMRNVESLTIDGFWQWGLALIDNISQLITTDPHVFGDTMMVLDSHDDFAFEWDKSAILKRSSKRSELSIKRRWYSRQEEELSELFFWRDFVDNLMDGTYDHHFDHLSLEFEIEDDDIEHIVYCQNDFEFWCKLDRNAMKRIGMRSMSIRYTYVIIHRDSTIADYALQKDAAQGIEAVSNHLNWWNYKYESIKSKFEKINQRHSNIQHGIGSVKEFFGEDLVCSYFIDYRLLLDGKSTSKV